MFKLDEDTFKKLAKISLDEDTLKKLAKISEEDIKNRECEPVKKERRIPITEKMCDEVFELFRSKNV